MDVYSTSFTFPHRTPHPHSPSASLDFSNGTGLPALAPNDPFHPPPPLTDAQQADADTVAKLVQTAMSVHGVHVACTPVGHSHWNFHITGAYHQVIQARGLILNECPVQARATIKVPRSDILDSPIVKPSLKPDVRRRLDEIASQTLVHIAVVNSLHPANASTSSLTPPDAVPFGSNNGFGASVGGLGSGMLGNGMGLAVGGMGGLGGGVGLGAWYGLEAERMCELVVTGQSNGVEIARVRLLAMLDELSGLHSEAVEIDHKLHGIIAGRKRAVIQTIQEETATNIYFPSPLASLFPGSASGPGPALVTPAVAPSAAAPPPPGGALRLNENVIWITGEFFGVQRARDMLFQVSLHKSKSVISRDAAILPRKLDWMLTDRADEVKAIMSDNATFIQFPPLGSSTSLVTVYGDHRVNVQRTLRAIMQLACQFYVASFWLLPVQFNVLLPPSTLNQTQLAPAVQKISNASGAEVVFKSMCFEMHGLEGEVRNAINMISELEMIKPFHHEIRFQIELANEHREFISGKKNGKINKIMQTTNVKIKFETFNDHNFLIDLSGNDSGVLQGLAMLQEELPAEISFHVPESYHKRIIGVGGRSIQRIMKKYGVYVKFSNAEEFAALGGYMDNEDNVVARTPAKNAMNLDNLKQSVMELVNPKDKDYMTESVNIPRRYHRTLLGEKAIFIHDIEGKTNCRVRFPDKETASDIVTIFGPESQVHIAAAMLLEHVSFEAEMPVPPSADLARVCATAEFVQFVEQIKHDLQIVIVPSLAGVPGNAGAGVGATGSGATSGGGGSGAGTPSESSFKFKCRRSNSEFLPTARELLEQFLLNHNVHVYPSANTHKRGDSFTEAFPHFDSKLLSTASAHRSHIPNHESVDLGRPSESLVDRRLRLASSSPDVKALFNNSPSYVYNNNVLEDHEENDETSSNYGGDYWTPLPPIGQGFGHRSRNSEDAFKRGSDSLLESKLSKPRSLTNRAQSLDLTFSMGRVPPPETSVSSTGAAAGTRFGSDSPTGTGSGPGTGGNSSPTSAAAPSFPSVGTQPHHQHSRLGGSLNHQMGRHTRINSETVEEVSRVISNLNL